MRTLRCLILAAAIALPAAPAATAPAARSASECLLFGDVALVARALALENVAEPRAAAILDHVYALPIARGGERFADAMAAIGAAARRHDGFGATGFAERLIRTCMEQGGSMDSILGQEM